MKVTTLATGDKISCQQYSSYLVSQEPVFDREILRDIRPDTAELLGFYRSGTFDAYSGTQHTVDRFKQVQPNLTAPWADVDGGECVGTPCDPDSNLIGWGNERFTYGRQRQSWQTNPICFDQWMTRTHAKEHVRQIIDEVLRPATSRIMSFMLMRRAAELAGKKICVTTGLPDFTFTWDAGGYVYMNSTSDPTGRLTPQILMGRVRPQYFQGAITKSNVKGFTNLQLQTDMDTYHYLAKDDPTLLGRWRFGDFGPAAKEFYEYGLMGYVGDFMVKCLQFPIRFNKISAGRYQLVLPFKNVATTNGIGEEFNADYDNAQYQWSFINNPGALRIMPFQASPVHPSLPFLIRDYGGKWRFAMHDLGADCNGKPINNMRQNKGVWFADFDVAIKPEHTEWIELFFHKVDKPCVVIIDTCNDEPYPYPQSYDSSNALCPPLFTFETTLRSGTYQVAANTIVVDGNTIVNSAINVATLALLVAALPSVSGGTWSIDDAALGTIKLSGSTATTVSVPFLA